MQLADFGRADYKIVLAFLEDLGLVLKAALSENLLDFLTIHKEHGEKEVMRDLHAEILVGSDFKNYCIYVMVFERGEGEER